MSDMSNFVPVNNGPKTTRIGSTVVLMEVKDAVKYFPDNNYRQLLSILKSLRVPIVYMRRRVVFNVVALEKALAHITMPGNIPFAFPGTSMRNQGKYDKVWINAHPGQERVKCRLTDEDAEEIKTGKPARKKQCRTRPKSSH